MDKRIILAVAGSGKTTYLINHLDLVRKFIVITYTDNNYNNIRNAIILKYGYIPENIIVQTFFQFLFSFCYRPLMADIMKTTGINWEGANYLCYTSKGEKAYYVDKYNNLYYNRISLLLQKDIAGVISRINKYCDCLYIDEVQDIAGNDFNFLLNISSVNSEILLVGDFFQHTFSTSNDGKINSNLFSNYSAYKTRFLKAGYIVDETTLIHSFRCSSSICDFVKSNLEIDISPANKGENVIKMIESFEEIKTILSDRNIIKLFYQNSARYPIYSLNWGDSKGINDFQDVCVVLNKSTYEAFSKGTISSLAPTTKNKLYVACTRAHKNVFFIKEEDVKSILDNHN
jgi:DNA helicase-2/ATP-dependent DNA helicase PcrA